MGLSFYQSIKTFYDYIFPLQIQQVNFVATYGKRHQSILEVGCANGKLSHALSQNYNVTGIDLEADFIQIAKNNYGETCTFLTLDMLKIKQLKQNYDVICCFGNTLAHLKGEKINQFIHHAYDKLNVGGNLLLQIVNYQHILNHTIKTLPLIENDTIRFERSYSWLNQEELNFHTKLYIKKQAKEVLNTINLSPITQKELTETLTKHRFKDIKCYSNFKKEALTETSTLLIISAKKK